MTEAAGYTVTKDAMLREMRIKARGLAYHSRVASDTWRHLYTEGQHLREVHLLAENILVQLEYVELAIKKGNVNANQTD